MVMIAFSLGAAMTALAQQDPFVTSLQTRLDRYYTAHAPAVLDMVLNQPAYVPGDTAWCSQWLMTEKEGAYIEGRQIVHQVVMNRMGEVVLRQNLLMNDGVAYGYIVVPEMITPGIYTVVSWTDGMLNRNRDMYCYRELMVCKDKTYSSTMPLSAYPEGGYLTANVLNRVVLTGRPFASVSLSGAGQLLETTTLDKDGYGEVKVVAKNSVQYTLTSDQGSVNMMPARPGVAMALQCYDSASMISIGLTSPTPRGGCHLVLVSRGRIIYTAMIDLGGTQVNVAVPRRIIPDGLIFATVFDKHNSVLCERLLSAKLPGDVLNIISAEEFHPRDSVSIAVKGKDLVGPVLISVFATDLFPPRDSDAAFRAMLPFNAIDFRTDYAWSLAEWNRFLITQHGSRFKWAIILDDSAVPLHAPGKYLGLKGRVSLADGRRLADSTRITVYLRKEARVYEESVASNGDFDMTFFFDYYGQEEVLYRIDRKGVVIPDALVTIEPDTISPFIRSSIIAAGGDNPYSDFALLRESAREAYTNFDVYRQLPLRRELNAAIEDELFEPDVTVRLDDFVLFPTMEETLREIVPSLQHRWRGKQHTVRVALQKPDLLATADPLYFIDGVPTDDTNYFMSLDPKDVATIKVVVVRDKLRPLGTLGESGVVFVTTKLSYHDARIQRSIRQFKITGLAAPLNFCNVPKTSLRTPLLSSTICFEAVFPGENEKGIAHFTAPDNVGNFTILAVAHTLQGTRVESSKSFRSSYRKIKSQ